jgi:hypothetical protein
MVSREMGAFGSWKNARFLDPDVMVLRLTGDAG